jgi:hypothetical protein
MTTFQVKHNAETMQVSFDKKYFSDDELLKILNFLRLEFLAKKIDFDEDIEALGVEINRNWWLKNKSRFIKE